MIHDNSGQNKIRIPSIFIFCSNDKERTGKRSKTNFKRGSSLSSGLLVTPTDTKKTKDQVKVKPKSNNVKSIKTKRRNSVPPDKDDKMSQRKVGVSQMTKDLPTQGSLSAADKFHPGPSKKNSISEIVQNNFLDKMKIAGDILRRSHSLDELNTLRKCFFTFSTFFDSFLNP